MELLFKQIRSEGGCQSFLVGDRKSGKACVVDPRFDELDLYEETARQNGVQIVYVLDTHIHADHYSGTSAAAQRFGARIAMGAKTKSARPDLLLKDGEWFELSSGLGIQTLETPGHTPDSVCFLAQVDQQQIVFTGDTLFIGGSGRTDFPGASAADQYESIYKKLAGLKESVWVFSGHEYSNYLFSTIGQEKRLNPHWNCATREEFIAMKNAELIDCPPLVNQVVDFNLAKQPIFRPRATCSQAVCGTFQAPDPSRPTPRIEIPDFREALEGAKTDAGVLCIDVRDRAEFEKGHIPGTENIPLSELWMSYEKLRAAKRIYLNCQTVNQSSAAVQSLVRLGVGGVEYVNGGYLEWIRRGFEVDK